jgi:hypothetical protein
MSVVLELQITGKPVLKGHDHYWRVIRRLGQNGALFTSRQVYGESNARHLQTIRDFIARLMAAGIIETSGDEGTGRFQEYQYRLLSRPLRLPKISREGKPGLQGFGQQQMWNILRGPQARGGITAGDLALLASTDDVAIRPGTAKTFLFRLKAAGLVRTVRAGQPHHPGLFRIVPAMNHGPMAPKILRTHCVYDPNTGDLFPRPLEAVEVAS